MGGLTGRSSQETSAVNSRHLSSDAKVMGQTCHESALVSEFFLLRTAELLQTEYTHCSVWSNMSLVQGSKGEVGNMTKGVSWG